MTFQVGGPKQPQTQSAAATGGPPKTDKPDPVTPEVAPIAAPVVVIDTTDNNGAVQPADTGFEPGSFKMPKPDAAGPAAAPEAVYQTSAPASLPKNLQENYGDLKKRLNANPNVEYIEIDRSDLNKGLSQFLTQFKDALEANPGLRDKLSQTDAGKGLLEALDHAAKGTLGTEDILNLQTFIVASGENISHPHSATGIDGQFGPRTHQGLQNAFAKLLDKPDEAIASLNTGYTTARTLADDQRTDYRNMGGDVVPGKTEMQPAPTGPFTPPAGTSTGADIVSGVNQTSGIMRGRLNAYESQMGRKVFRCYEGVKLALSKTHPPISLEGGSAYMAADQLRSKYADRFSDIRSLNPNDPRTRETLKNLPAGAIVVWGRSDNAALRSQNPNNGYSHGHISIATGNGYEYSDRPRAQITGGGDRYSTCTVFIPK